MANPELMTGLGAAFSIFLCSAGSVVGSVQAGIYALQQNGGGIFSFFPIIIAGVLSIYGIIIAVILSGQSDINEANGFKNLCAGLSVGLASIFLLQGCIHHVTHSFVFLTLFLSLYTQACLMSGIGMSNFLEKHMAPSRITSRNTRATTCCGDQQEPLISGDTQSYAIPPTSWSLIMVMVFLEAIGLYGLIVALILSSHDKQ